MKVKYGRLFVDLLLLAMIPLLMLLLGVGTWTKVKNLELQYIENKQLSQENLGKHTLETAVVHYIMDVEFEMRVNQELNTLALSYIFLGATEGILLMFVFSKFKHGKYIEARDESEES